MRRPVHPAALLAAGVFLGWALAQPFPTPVPNESKPAHRALVVGRS